MIIKFVMKFLPTCLPSGLTVAAPDAFGRIPGVMIQNFGYKASVEHGNQYHIKRKLCIMGGGGNIPLTKNRFS